MRAIEIRIRAERRCGELLAEMEKAKGAAQPGVGRAGGTGSQRATTLSDLGISKTQASRWQKLAEVPEEEFEATFARSEKPSTTGIINRGSSEKIFLRQRLPQAHRRQISPASELPATPTVGTPPRCVEPSARKEDPRWPGGAGAERSAAASPAPKRKRPLPPALAANIWKRGQSGNPAGLSGAYGETVRLAGQAAPVAINRLIELMSSADERVASVSASRGNATSSLRCPRSA